MTIALLGALYRTSAVVQALPRRFGGNVTQWNEMISEPRRSAGRACGLTVPISRRSLRRAPADAFLLSETAPGEPADMLRIALLFLFPLLLATPVNAGPAEDATAAVTGLLDKFNGGDIDAFFAAHQDDALIIDEFAPYVWSGSGSARRWAGDYSKDATTRGISGGKIDYGPPIQANSAGTSAYIVLPTTYRFMQRGKKMAGKGSMTFVMTRAGTDWKIASWTYAGARPAGE